MKNSYSIKTYAKINLTLDVTGKRPDGYHNIDSIFEEISVFDTVTVYLNDSEKTTVSCNVSEVPCDDRNIVWKAADVFFSTQELKIPVSTFTSKKIFLVRPVWGEEVRMLQVCSEF